MDDEILILADGNVLDDGEAGLINPEKDLESYREHKRRQNRQKSENDNSLVSPEAIEALEFIANNESNDTAGLQRSGSYDKTFIIGNARLHAPKFHKPQVVAPILDNNDFNFSFNNEEHSSSSENDVKCIELINELLSSDSSGNQSGISIKPQQASTSLTNNFSLSSILNDSRYSSYLSPKSDSIVVVNKKDQVLSPKQVFKQIGQAFHGTRKLHKKVGFKGVSSIKKNSQGR